MQAQETRQNVPLAGVGQDPLQEALREMIRQEITRALWGRLFSPDGQMPGSAGPAWGGAARARAPAQAQAQALARAPAQAQASQPGPAAGWTLPPAQPIGQSRASQGAPQGPPQGAGQQGERLTHAMAASLEKLRAVLEETEQIAQKMEELLAQEGRARSGRQGAGGGQGGAGGRGGLGGGPGGPDAGQPRGRSQRLRLHGTRPLGRGQPSG